jgi:hypothetical protein
MPAETKQDARNSPFIQIIVIPYGRLGCDSDVIVVWNVKRDEHEMSAKGKLRCYRVKSNSTTDSVSTADRSS